MKDITIKVSGSITIGMGDFQLHENVRKVIESGYDIIVLDFAGVDYMDSSAVGELAASFSSVQKAGVHMALTSLQPKVKQLLSMMSFLEIFKVFESTEGALQVLRRRVTTGVKPS